MLGIYVHLVRSNEFLCCTLDILSNNKGTLWWCFEKILFLSIFVGVFIVSLFLLTLMVSMYSLQNGVPSIL